MGFGIMEFDVMVFRGNAIRRNGRTRFVIDWFSQLFKRWLNDGLWKAHLTYFLYSNVNLWSKLLVLRERDHDTNSIFLFCKYVFPISSTWKTRNVSDTTYIYYTKWPNGLTELSPNRFKLCVSIIWNSEN